MKSLHAFGLISLMLGTLGCAQSRAMTPMQNRVSVPPCDVVNEDFCFALTRGATSTLSIPVDFKLYEVVLPNKQKIIVYYGSQPDYPEGSEPAFSNQMGSEKVRLYRQEVDGMQLVDVFYEKEREEFTIAVHVRSKLAPADKPDFFAFLSGMRKCDSDRKGLIECTPDLVFAKLLQEL